MNYQDYGRVRCINTQLPTKATNIANTSNHCPRYPNKTAPISANAIIPHSQILIAPPDQSLRPKLPECTNLNAVSPKINQNTTRTLTTYTPRPYTHRLS